METQRKRHLEEVPGALKVVARPVSDIRRSTPVVGGSFRGLLAGSPKPSGCENLQNQHRQIPGCRDFTQAIAALEDCLEVDRER